MAEISVVRKKPSSELWEQVPAPKLLSLRYDLELLKVSLAEERIPCYFFLHLVKILSLPLAFPVLAVWSSGWPPCVGVTLGFSGTAVICQLRHLGCKKFPLACSSESFVKRRAENGSQYDSWLLSRPGCFEKPCPNWSREVESWDPDSICVSEKQSSGSYALREPQAAQERWK